MRHTTSNFTRNSGGLNQRSSPLEMPHTDSPDLLNIDLSLGGAIRKRRGVRLYDGTPLGSAGKIQALTRYAPPGSSQRVLAVEAGSVHLEDAAPGSFTQIASGLHATSQWDTLAYNNKIYLTNGHDAPMVYDGTVYQSMALAGATLPPAWAADPPSGIAMVSPHRLDRAAAWGISAEPSRVFFSHAQDPEDWSTGGIGDVAGFSVHVLKDNGEAVTAVAPLYDLTVCFKKTEAAVYGGDSAFNYRMIQVFPVGCPAAKSIVHVGRDLYFWSQHGPAKASGVEQYGDVAPLGLSAKVADDVATCNWNSADRIQAAHDRDNSRIIWFYPTGASNRNNQALAYYYDIDAWVRLGGLAAEAATDYPTAGAGNRVLLGGYAGELLVADEALDDNGAAIESYYITPWYQFGSIAERKRVLDLVVASGARGKDAEIYYQWDFESAWTWLCNLEDFGDIGAAYWDEGSCWDAGAYWDSAKAGIARPHPRGSGRAFRLKFENNNMTDTFEIMGWSIVTSHRGRR